MKKIATDFIDISGRTMIEMIMVLAIMGVLTIMGVLLGQKMQYQYMADSAVEEVGIYAVSGSKMLALGQTDLSLSADTITTSGYNVQMGLDTSNADETDSYFVALSNVPSEVCELLQSPKLEAIEKVVVLPDNCTSTENNTVAFYFTGDLMADNFMQNNPDWQNQIDDIPDACDSSAPYQGTDGVCYACDDFGDLPLLVNDCARCDLREMWDGVCVLSECGKYSQIDVPYEGSDGICYACNSPGDLPISSTDCNECEEREMWEGLCVVSECGKYSNANKPYTRSDGSCYACATDYILNDAGTNCVHCPDTYIRPMDENVCRCPEGYGESSLDNYYKENVCLPYCTGNQEESGLILLIDRSASTASNSIYKYIDSALKSLNIPTKIKTALYLDHGTGVVNKIASQTPKVSYSYNNNVTSYFSNYNFRYTPSGTEFDGPFINILNTVCTGKEKLLMMMWTDGYLAGSPLAYVSAILSKCPGSKFYYVGLSTNPFSSVSSLSYNIKDLPITYADTLVQEIYENACIEQ